MGQREGVKTQSIEEFWQSNLESAEKMQERAHRNLAIIALRDHPRLFEVEPAPLYQLRNDIAPRVA